MPATTSNLLLEVGLHLAPELLVIGFPQQSVVVLSKPTSVAFQSSVHAVEEAGS